MLPLRQPQHNTPQKLVTTARKTQDLVPLAPASTPGGPVCFIFLVNRKLLSLQLPQVSGPRLPNSSLRFRGEVQPPCLLQWPHFSQLFSKKLITSRFSFSRITWVSCKFLTSASHDNHESPPHIPSKGSGKRSCLVLVDMPMHNEQHIREKRVPSYFGAFRRNKKHCVSKDGHLVF